MERSSFAMVCEIPQMRRIAGPAAPPIKGPRGRNRHRKIRFDLLRRSRDGAVSGDQVPRLRFTRNFISVARLSSVVSHEFEGRRRGAIAPCNNEKSRILEDMTIGTIHRLALASLSFGIAATVAGMSPGFAADTYDLNVILSLTGGASFLGKAEQQSLQLAEQSTNETGGIAGRPLHLVFHDDQSSPQVAVQLASQVVASHPAVEIGANLVAMCNAMAPLMQSGPVMYCLSPGIHPASGGYVFTSSVSTFDLSRALITYFRLKGWTKLAIMTSTDASGQDAEKGLNANLALPDNSGMTVVAREHFNPTDVSVSAQIENIKAAGPQALIAWSTGAPIGTIFKGIIQAGLDVPVGTTDGNMTFAQMNQYAAFLPKRLFIPAAEWAMQGTDLPRDPGVQAAQERFTAIFKAAKVTPDVASALAWDPAMIVIDALRKLGPDATAVQVRDYISHLKNYAGVDGIYDFEREPQRGLDVNDAIVTLWDPEKKNWLPVAKPTGLPLD
jgi:branched-chain amino acid transport system substrate-binding protein